MNTLVVVKEPSLVVYNVPEPGGLIEDIIGYGTKITITEEKQEWVHIEYRGWHGWVCRDKLITLQEDPSKNADAFVDYRGAYVFTKPDTEYGYFLELPFETPLKILEELPDTHQRWLCVQLQEGQTGYIQRSQIVFSQRHLSLPEMVQFSHNFLGTKYLWGGTTSFGYDCSGFVQMLYRQMDITLPRNSSQQYQDSQFIAVTEPQAGDLIFFRNSQNKICHVGMMVNEKEFIHAFTKQEAWICISSLLDERFHNGHFYYGLETKRLSSYF